jgi:putative ABC transport system substrate-binding protein
MDRRSFIISGIAVTVLAAPLAAEAQPAGRLPRIGVLGSGVSGQALEVIALRQGLEELGYVEGKTIVLELRWPGIVWPKLCRHAPACCDVCG